MKTMKAKEKRINNSDRDPFLKRLADNLERALEHETAESLNGWLDKQREDDDYS